MSIKWYFWSRVLTETEQMKLSCFSAIPMVQIMSQTPYPYFSLYMENCPVSCIYLPGSNWKSREYIWLYLLIKIIVIFWEAVWMCCYVEAWFLCFFFYFFKLLRIQDFQMISAVVLQPLSPWTITLLLFAYYNACWENCWDWDFPKQKASGASRLGRLFNAQLECNRC